MTIIYVGMFAYKHKAVQTLLYSQEVLQYQVDPGRQNTGEPESEDLL